MTEILSQRTECGAVRWKAPGDVFSPFDFEVARIDDDTTASAFIETHHYARSYPAAAHRFGLYDWRGALQGVAVFSTGTNRQTITNVFGEPDAREIDKLRARGIRQLPTHVPGAPQPWREAFELGRFVLRDAVPYNAESWFLARCFEQLASVGVKGVVSFSDPYPRRRKDGRLAFLGHWGQIYQATNALYTGRGTARTLRLFDDATVFSDRAQAKIRGREEGWQGSVAQLVLRGAPELNEGEAPASWLKRVQPAITRTVRHPGNHRYVFTLAKRVPPVQLAEQTRPKATDPVMALQRGLAL
jgi:hypothetical protein